MFTVASGRRALANYFEPEESESAMREYWLTQKLGKAEASRRALESRQATMKRVKEYLEYGLQDQELLVSFPDSEYEYINIDLNEPDPALEELRVLLSLLPSRNHC